MLPGTEKRKPRNSNKVNLVLSLTFHTLIVIAVFYFAAREGLLGNKLHTIAINMEQQEKKPEPKPQVKPREPEPAKEPEAKPVEEHKIETAKNTPAPPPPSAPVNTEPDVAPPPSEAPVFYFGGGAHVDSGTPVQVYKGLLQHALEFNWDRPRDMDEQTNAAEVEIAVSKSGEITSPVLKKTSGQKKWDESVLAAIASTRNMKSPPPSNFPPRVVVRFYVEAQTPIGE